jgi:hypothetical protein
MDTAALVWVFRPGRIGHSINLIFNDCFLFETRCSMGRPAAVRKALTVTIYGHPYRGTYFVQDSIVYVQSPYGSKTTQVGGEPPEMTAKLLLSEIIRARAEALH